MEEPVQRDEHFLCTPVTKCVLTVIKGTSFDRKTLDSALTNCCFGVESFEIFGVESFRPRKTHPICAELRKLTGGYYVIKMCKKKKKNQAICMQLLCIIHLPGIEIEHPNCSFDSLEIELQVSNVWTISKAYD